MPAVIPFIPLIVGALGSGAAVYAANKSSNTAERTSNQAIDYAKQQEAERRREWDIAQSAAKQQWDTQQANLAPYRAARAAILRKHGIDVPDVVAPKAPDFSSGPPPGWKPGDPVVPATAAASAAPKSTGSGLGALALGGLASGIGAAASLYKPQQSPYTNIPGPYTPGAAVGAAGGPPGPPGHLRPFRGPSCPTGTATRMPSGAPTSQYGVPGQTYQGE